MRESNDAAEAGLRSSRVTVVLAGAANVLIAVAKLVAALLTGSAAMMSEAAHSFADTLNEIFLLAALRRSTKPADADHPFGYGMERYFWSLLAAVAIFVLGAGFSVTQGVRALIDPQRQGSLTLALVVLAGALTFDGISLGRALVQVRREAAQAGTRFASHLAHDAEPAVRAVVFEDSVAVLGIALAAGGLLLDHLLATTYYDAAASIAIGLLLVGVAYVLGRQNQQLLIGRAVGPDVLAGIREEVERSDAINGVDELMTMRLGPDAVLLAARVHVDAGITGADLEVVADEIDAGIRVRYPEVEHVFLDPTPRSVETRTTPP